MLYTQINARIVVVRTKHNSGDQGQGIILTVLKHLVFTHYLIILHFFDNFTREINNFKITLVGCTLFRKK